jgi:hypothetical protein
MQSEEDAPREIDPLQALLGQVGEEDAPAPSPSDPKSKTKQILMAAGPAAAKRLAGIAEHGDDKEAVSAASHILDRIGFGKGDADPARPSSNALPQQALIAALLGIGKVLGLKESEKLRNVTPESEPAIPTEATEVLPAPVRKRSTSPVHRGGLDKAPKSKKIRVKK